MINKRKLLLAATCTMHILCGASFQEASAAIRSGNGAVLRQALEESPDLVYACGAFNTTLLHSAAGWGSAETVQILLDHGADIEAKNEYGSTPLHYAAGEGNREAAKTLLEHNADTEVKNTCGYTPLCIARRYNHSGVTSLLLEYAINSNANIATNSSNVSLVSNK